MWRKVDSPGDANTLFFHGVANGRKRKRHIFSLQDGESTISDFTQIQTHIYDYYKKLFGREGCRNVHLSDDVWGTNLRLSEEDKLDLVKPFTFQEIDEVIKGMKSNTAPGPDGFPVGFYKNMWPEFRVLVKEMLDELHQGSLDTDRLKYGVVTLLPKVLDANTIKQYRPICVQNVIIKILTKTINERVARVADKIISWTQTAFIPGRNILEGCVILHETLHELKRKGEKGVIFKIDFEKAYDRVNWGFLYEVMKKNNFSPELISWVKKFNEGAKVSINIYGDQGPFFRTFRGLRQGDPLSPLLFNLVGDALAVILEKAKERGILKGLVPDLVPRGLSHLQYADDTILFIKVGDDNVRVLKFLLFCFEEMSGMKINYQKSEVYVLGVDKEEEIRIANMLNCKVGTMPFTYLGLPMHCEKVGMKDFRLIIQKMEKRLQTWKSGYLTYGGRKIKINSCMSSAPMYAMGFYYLPGEFHKKMDSLRGNFY